MAQFGENNGNRTSGYGTGLSGQSAASKSGSGYESGYRGDNRRDDDEYGSNMGSGSYSSSATGRSYGAGQYGSLQSYGSDRDRDSSDSSATNYGSTRGSGSSSGIAIEETHRLIGSDKVEGTAVYDRNGDRIGTIHNFMVDKRSGKVEYAVMSFGGFLGMGQTYYPLPWKMLDYDTDLGGFRVEIDEEDLDHAPSFRAGGEPDFDNQYGRQVYGYYGFAW
jgi:hypothetical protein